MSFEGISKNDPQIHLIATKFCEKIDSIRNNTQEQPDAKDIQAIESSIKFFSHFIKYLPECNIEVLNMCRMYLAFMNDEAIEIDPVVVNRLVGICTNMMILRKEEGIIRATCVVLKEILVVISPNVLKSIVTKYFKTLSLIFQKIYLVQTYYTQLWILDIFVFITKDLKELRKETIVKHQLMRSVEGKVLKHVLDELDKIDSNNFTVTSRKFLKFYNNNLFSKTCILSIEGRIIEINDLAVKQPGNMLTTFNGRNLTVSFFIPKDFLIEKETGISTQMLSQKNQLIFIELECDSIDAEEKSHNNKNFIDVNILVKQAQTYDDHEVPISLDDIKIITIRLNDVDFILKRFLNVFFDKYKLNERMCNDNASIIDKESIMTFQTSISIAEDLNTLRDAATQQSKIIQAPNVKTEIIQNLQKNIKIEGQKKPKINKTDEEKVENVIKPSTQKTTQKSAAAKKMSDINLNTRPKRQRAQVSYKATDVYNEDNISETSDLPTFREYKSQQKKVTPKRKADEMNSEKNYSLQPAEVITKTTKTKNFKISPPAKKTTSSKRAAAHFETDDENDAKENIRKTRKGRQPKVANDEIVKGKLEALKSSKVNVKAKPKEQPEKMNFDALMGDDSNKRKSLSTLANNTTAKKLKVTVKSENQNPKKLFEEVVAGIMNKSDDSEMYESLLDEPEKVVDKKPIKKLQVREKRENVQNDFITEAYDDDSLYNYDVGKVNEKQVKVENLKGNASKKRKLTIDDILNSPIDQRKKSKVEEWLQSTSTSFDIFENEQIELPTTSNVPKKITCRECPIEINAVLPAKDIEDESSYGSDGVYGNDEHQHYSSSSSQLSIDSDAKEENQKATIATIEKFSPPISTQQYHQLASQRSSKVEPCTIFQERSKELADKLLSRKKKLDDNEKQVFSKYNRSIQQCGQKCMEQVRKTKDQVKLLTKLRFQYEAAKSKLVDEINEHEKLASNLMLEIGKRREAYELHNQIKKKELSSLKKEAVRKNEELMHEVWREYVDNFQASFNSSIKKAYEI